MIRIIGDVIYFDNVQLAKINEKQIPPTILGRALSYLTAAVGNYEKNHRIFDDGDDE